MLYKLHQICAVNSFRENRLVESHYSGPACHPVNSLGRITLENNGEIRLAVEERNLSSREDGGEDGIRTHEAVLPLTPLAGERLRPLGHLSGAVYAYSH